MTEHNLDESEDSLALRYLQRQFDYPKDIVKKKKKDALDELRDAIQDRLKDYYERKIERDLKERDRV